MTLEECLEFIDDDELLEVTPQNLRMRKRELSHQDRARAASKGQERLRVNPIASGITPTGLHHNEPHAERNKRPRSDYRSSPGMP